MTHAVLAELEAQVGVLEGVAGGRADVEWAWDGEAVWFLQCRPITTLGTLPCP